MNIYDKNGNLIIDVKVDDSSVRYRSIMTDDSLTLNFSLPSVVTIPVLSYVMFEGQRYTLWRPQEFKKHGARIHEYTLLLHGWREFLKFVKYKDMGAQPYRLKFSLTATPVTFLRNLVSCLNANDPAGGWSAGDCVEAPERTLSFNHEYCIDVLNRFAQEWQTEYELEGKKIHLRKVEKFKDSPLALSYGKGNGFLPGVGRYNEGDKPPVGRLHVQGGERNIDPSAYGSVSLLLPKNASIVRDGKTYRADAAGMYITRYGNANQAEDSYDGADFYPRRVGTVSHVIAVFAQKHLYDIRDTSIPASLNFRDYRIAGEKAVIKFESGALAGREFDLEQTDTELTGYIHSERRFKIVPAEMDGVTMPGGVFVPSVGDKYAIFNVSMPAAYISDDATRTGASWDMFREAVRYFAENENERFRFTGDLDGVWSKSRWLEIGGKIVPGGHVLFSDEQFQQEGVLIRIVAVQDHVNEPHKPRVTLSNAPVPVSFSSEIAKLKAGEVVIEDAKKEILRFTKRQWRDTIETMEMLEASMLNFGNSVNPITVRTMQMIVGDESLQFRFVNSKVNPARVDHSFTFNQSSKQFSTPAGIIQHMTLGITTLSTSNAAKEYKFWDLSGYTSPALDPGKAYYLYARCAKTSQSGTFTLSESAIAMEAETGYYHLLVGILNSEGDGGNRSFAQLNGYSEILPGRVTTDRIVSEDGSTYFDLLNGVIAGNIRFINAEGEEEELRQGLDGTSSYVFIRYSQVASGDGMTSSPTGAKYIGVSVTQTSTAPTDASAYDWSLIKGADGLPGEPGQDGQTSYLHIKYSNDGGITFTGNNGEDEGAWIGVYVDFTQADSNDPDDYTWNRLKGDKGDKGETGNTGNTGNTGDGVRIRYKRSETRPETPDQSDLNPVGWLTAPDSPDNVDVYEIKYDGDWTLQSNGEMKSDAITHNEKTLLRLRFRTYQDNVTIKLTARVSSEQGYDKLHISKLDTPFNSSYSNELKNISGTKTEALTYTVATKGEHFVDFEYAKDSSGSSGDDAAYVSIVLPVRTVWITTCAVVAGEGMGWSVPRIYLDDRIEDVVAKAYMAAAVADKFGTTIDGGLISTVTILLRALNSTRETAGISGSQGQDEKNPAYWSGGTYAQAFAFVEFMHHMEAGTPPGSGTGQFNYASRYADLAPIVMLHNGAAKIGSFIVESGGRIMLIDPATGLPRLTFHSINVSTVSDITGTSSQGSVNVSGGSTSGSTVLTGSTNVENNNSNASVTAVNISISATGRAGANGSSYASATLYARKNGVRVFPVASVGITFNDSNYESLQNSYFQPARVFNAIPAGNYTFELVVSTMGDIVSRSASVSSFTFAWEFVPDGLRMQQYGLDGMVFSYANEHFHFSEGNGLDLRGKTNMPGVLAAGSVVANGRQSNVWGDKARTDASATPISGGFTVPLKNLTHSNYVVQVTPHTNVTFRVGAKSSSSFTVYGSGGFDYVVIGRNY